MTRARENFSIIAATVIKRERARNCREHARRPIIRKVGRVGAVVLIAFEEARRHESAVVHQFATLLPFLPPTVTHFPMDLSRDVTQHGTALLSLKTRHFARICVALINSRLVTSRETVHLARTLVSIDRSGRVKRFDILAKRERSLRVTRNRTRFSLRFSRSFSPSPPLSLSLHGEFPNLTRGRACV